MEHVFKELKGAVVLDYVTAQYLKAAQYIQNSKIKVAFVSTNSVAQGEKVGILWNKLFNKYKIKIHFAHRTFRWSNEAKDKAVDAAYRSKPFESEVKRMEFLFELYEKYTTDLFTKKKSKE